MLSEKIVRVIFRKADGKEDDFIQDFNKHRNLSINLKSLDEDLHKLKESYERDRKTLQEIKDGLISSCEHIVTTFHRDASGNNDNWTSCDICGKAV